MNTQTPAINFATLLASVPPLYSSNESLSRTPADFPRLASLPMTLPPLMMAAPDGFVPPPRKPEPALDYEMKWSDIDESDIRRFQLEEQGRCYASHYIYDTILDVYRQIYFTYPEDIRRSGRDIPEEHHSGIFYRDIKTAESDLGIITSTPSHS